MPENDLLNDVGCGRKFLQIYSIVFNFFTVGFFFVCYGFQLNTGCGTDFYFKQVGATFYTLVRCVDLLLYGTASDGGSKVESFYVYMNSNDGCF